MTQPAVVIVGAGILGCLIARELAARDPELSVTVLDRDAVGAGASRRSAGLHLPRGGSPRTRRMSARSHAYYAELRSRDPDLPIYPVGATVISPDDGPGPDYLSEAAPVPAAGSGHPAVDVPDGCRAWRLSGCHHADVHQLARRLAAGLRPRVRFAEGVAVTGLAADSGGVTVTTGTGERLAADYVVLAPGPWLAAPAWRDLVAPLGLRVKKVVALHIGHRPEPGDQAMLFDADDAFLLPVAHQGQWLFSYASPEWDVDPDAPGRRAVPGRGRRRPRPAAPLRAVAGRGLRRGPGLLRRLQPGPRAPGPRPGRRGPHRLRRRRQRLRLPARAGHRRRGRQHGPAPAGRHCHGRGPQ